MRNDQLSVVLITLNEAHNLERFFKSIEGWVTNIFVLDSYSIDDTVDICLKHGAKVYQRKFDNFGAQWNAAISIPEINTEWVMKLDPDEVMTENLKININSSLSQKNKINGYYLDRKLFFFRKKLPVTQQLLRIWRNGKCTFSNSLVNEHANVQGDVGKIRGYFEHHDSPNLEHWTNKQNNYTSAEASSFIQETAIAIEPRIFGNSLQRRMFIKKYFFKIPFRYKILFFYHYLFLGAFVAGREGFYWAQLRTMVYQITEYKIHEMKIHNVKLYQPLQTSIGKEDSRCIQIS